MDLYERYDNLLASYAVKNAGDHKRVYPEQEHPDKLPFQRDRDRIIHSKAFRRLKHKTQVMVAPGDYYRDRLTHSIEGAQIARSLCRALELNEDLAEAAILAHDLGHPPFGHEGEHALDELLKPHGFGFDHNEHSVRIVTQLERSYPDFSGLNLCSETLNALKKHDVPWENPEATTPHHASLEAQIVNLADEISYYSHDVDDGIRAGLITWQQVKELQIGFQIVELIETRYPDLDESSPLYHAQIIRSLIHLLITDIVKTTKTALADLKISTVENVYQIDKPIAHYSKKMDDQTQELRAFLFEQFYHSETVRQNTNKGQELLKELFHQYFDNPTLLPEKEQDKINETTPKAIVIKDYIAGMTDPFAKQTVLGLRKRIV